MSSDIFLNRGRSGLESLYEQQRLVLPLELALPVIDGMNGRDDRAAPRQMFDHQGLAQSLGVVSATGRHHDQHGLIAFGHALILGLFGRSNQTVATTLSLIHISEPTRLGMISYAVFCL